ncbi:hypothetical protein [Halioglobus sp. HI00S01]|uniref:hypothetical protein n=1 Tax=Halioglobus sp. HI00S01 TaxID=1822214 RepID=UPI0012E72539|nr:hypothetical protein [Halioglobus sp. HI00S01]
MTDLPTPDKSGSSGEQELATVVEPEQPIGAFEGIAPVAHTMAGLAATNSRSLGGEVAANVLSASVSQISAELIDTKRELNHVRGQLDECRNTTSTWREKAGVLQERVKGARTARNLGNAAITLGTAAVGVAIELYRQSLNTTSYLVGAIGIAIVLLGWFAGSGGSEE